MCVCVCVCFLQAKGLSQKDLATKLMIPAKTIQVTKKTILMESDNNTWILYSTHYTRECLFDVHACDDGLGRGRRGRRERIVALQPISAMISLGAVSLILCHPSNRTMKTERPSPTMLLLPRLSAAWAASFPAPRSEVEADSKSVMEQ